MTEHDDAHARERGDEGKRSDDEAIKAAEFLLATRQREEALQRGLAQTPSTDEHGKELLAEMIELQQHSTKPRD